MLTFTTIGKQRNFAVRKAIAIAAKTPGCTEDNYEKSRLCPLEREKVEW